MNPVSRSHIFFKINDYFLALPSANVLKVIPTPPPSQGGMVSMGLVQLQQYSIQILKLEKLLGLESPSENPPFLIVMRNDLDEDLWGIAVDMPPELINITEDVLRPVPDEIRLPGALQWISHVVTCLETGAHTDIPNTLLVLDLPVL